MLNILFEDTEIISCEKPPGVPSQSDKTGDKDMLTIVNEYLAKSSPDSQAALVHRLDRAVGGVMVFAKTKQSAAALSRDIQAGDFKKTYLAVVNGRAERSSVLCDYLIKNERLNISKAVQKGVKNAKEAILSYERTGHIHTENGDLSMLEISLKTGRHHQIRVQLSHHGLPIWGDTKYNPLFFRKPGFHKTALWSYVICFKHPKTYEVVRFTLPPGKDEPWGNFM